MTKLKEIIFQKPKMKNLLILLIYGLLILLITLVFSSFINQDFLQKIVEKSGFLGVFVYGLIEILYVTFTPLLNTFILIFSGYLFGAYVGFLINFFSTILGLFLIVFLVKRYGRPLLKKFVTPKFYQSFDEIVKKVGPIILLIVYVLPFTPDDELTYIIAAGPVSFKRFILPIILGTIAKSAYSYIGALGSDGLIISFYFRLVMLIVGLLLVGFQEYIIKERGLDNKKAYD